jgi:AcrR family transcriptional regulator
MGRPENYEHSEFRRNQILETALHVIGERGFSETRIADIAKRAGISNGLVMYYFPTKVDLLVASIRFAEDGWYCDMQEILAGIDGATEQLEALAAVFLMGGNTPMLQLTWSLWLDLWSQSTRSDAIAQVHRESDNRWRAMLTEVVDRGVATGDFTLLGSTENTVIALSAMFDGFAVNVACNDGTVTPASAFVISMRFAALALGFTWANDEASAARLNRYIVALDIKS